MFKTSKAFQELLIRKGITPTGNFEEDLKLARTVMPRPREGNKNGINDRERN